ncbi:MAG: hypothetical protein FJZ97_13280 [Chloroflexi bacterium]|nr:hypothetical protein [Chloroflexota bacterium]
MKHGHAEDVFHREAPGLTARELRARQVVLAQGTLDTWRAKFERYQTSLTSCGCPDSLYRPRFSCKHQIALRLLSAREEGDT